MPVALGMLSNSALSPWVYWATVSVPFYRELAKLGDAWEIAPPPLKSLDVGGYARAIKSAYRANALFSFQRSARLENPLQLVSLARGRVRRSTFVIDPWKDYLGKIDLLADLQGIDRCYIPYRQALDDLAARGKSDRYRYLPFGADTSIFGVDAERRDIDIFWMGRRYEPLHHAILAYAEKHGLNYIYREKTGIIHDAAELGRMTSRSRYFVVTPPDLDNIERTGGYSPMPMRYFEGLCAGCRLLGVLPRSGEYEALLPRAAVLEVDPDGSDLAAKLDADVDDLAAWAAVDQARDTVRADHSWAARARTVWDDLVADLG